jgi:adenylate cyclase
VLRGGETVIGRAPSCDIVVNVSSLSRAHARVKVADGRCTLTDAGSRYGILLNGEPLTAGAELTPGDVFQCGTVAFTVEQSVPAQSLLSEEHHLLEDSGTLLRRVGEDERPAGPGAAEAGAEAVEPDAGGLVPADRRQGADRREGRPGYRGLERRSGRERRQARLLRLLTEIGKTLVTLQPLPQVLSRVVDLVFDVVPAERAFLLLRDSAGEALTARVLRHRDGSVPEHTTLSRTVINKVIGERVAMLAADALYDTRLDSAGSIQAMNIRSFVCAPLWNRNEVIGVLYADNPRSKRFIAEDLDVFTALANYAAVAIDRARVAEQLLQETKRRERLQRYHSPGVVNRILHAGTGADAPFMAQEREVTVMFCDLVSFTAMCEGMKPFEIAQLLNQFFTRMADVIFEFEGTLDKFIGDAILAVFGAPFEQSDHADRAVEAALAMQRALKELNQGAERPLRMRMALNSGRAMTGDIGSPRRREFTVLGDVVNTASRIESSVAQPDQIVISRGTLDRLTRKVPTRSMGNVSLRGRHAEIEVFEVLT